MMPPAAPVLPALPSLAPAVSQLCSCCPSCSLCPDTHTWQLWADRPCLGLRPVGLVLGRSFSAVLHSLSPLSPTLTPLFSPQGYYHFLFFFSLSAFLCGWSRHLQEAQLPVTPTDTSPCAAPQLQAQFQR